MQAVAERGTDELGRMLGRMRFEMSGSLIYQHTSAAAGWSGACLTHLRLERSGQYDGCWSTLRISTAIPSQTAPGRHPAAGLTVGVPGQPCSGTWSGVSETVSLFVDVGLVERTFGAPFSESTVLAADRTLHGDGFVEHLLNALLADVIAGSPDGPVPGETLVLLILRRIRAYRPAPSEATATRLSRAEIRRLQAYVAANLASSLHLEDLAGCVAMSPRHLCRTLRNTLGLTPHRYLVQCRTEHARALLVAGARSLDEVAERSGFADRTHMSTTFRRLLGTTPSHIRNTRGESDEA